MTKWEGCGTILFWAILRQKLRTGENYKNLMISCFRSYKAEATKYLQESYPSVKYSQFCLQLWQHTQLRGCMWLHVPTHRDHMLATPEDRFHDDAVWRRSGSKIDCPRSSWGGGHGYRGLTLDGFSRPGMPTVLSLSRWRQGCISVQGDSWWF
jgi:hypothetical protein